MKAFAHRICVAAVLLAAMFGTGCEKQRPSTSGAFANGTTTREAQKRSAPTKENVQDAETSAKVMDAIFQEPDLRTTEIRVETLDGAVTLTGAVDSPESLERATKVARRVDGVKSVDNRLQLRPRA